MNNKYNNLDELLKESLKDYGKKPSAGIWQRITLRLWMMEKGIYFLIPILIAVFIFGYFLFNNSESSTTIINVDNAKTTELINTDSQETAIKSETQNNDTKENISNSKSEQIEQQENNTIGQTLKSDQEQQAEMEIIRKNKIPGLARNSN